MNVFGGIFTGLRVLGVLMTEFPKAMADGVITVDEGFRILKKCADEAGLPTAFEVPEEMRAASVGVKTPLKGDAR